MYNPIPAMFYLAGIISLVNANGNVGVLIFGAVCTTVLFIFTLNYMAKLG